MFEWLFKDDRVFVVVYCGLLGLYIYLKYQMRRLETPAPLAARRPLPRALRRERAAREAPVPAEQAPDDGRAIPPPQPVPVAAGAQAGPGRLGVSTLVRLVSTSPDTPVRVEAIRALGQLRAKEAIRALGDALESPDPDVATEAANALGQIGDPSAIDMLVRNTQRVAEELRRLTPVPGTSSMPSARSADALEPQLPSPAWSQPEAVNKAPLAKIIDPLARKNFQVLNRYTPYDLRKLSEDEIVDILVAIARNRAEANSTRYFALKNLAYFRHREIGSNLIGLLQEEQPTIRYTAAELLGSHGDDAAIPALIEALEDENPYVRSSAALSLAALNSDRAIRPLMGLRSDPEEVVRYSVKKALEEIGRRKGLSAALLREAS